MRGNYIVYPTLSNLIDHILPRRTSVFTLIPSISSALDMISYAKPISQMNKQNFSKMCHQTRTKDHLMLCKVLYKKILTHPRKVIFKTVSRFFIICESKLILTQTIYRMRLSNALFSSTLKRIVKPFEYCYPNGIHRNHRLTLPCVRVSKDIPNHNIFNKKCIY